MSITQVNPTDKMTEETIEEDAHGLFSQLGIGPFSKTEIKRFDFKYDPWEIKATNNTLLVSISGIDLAVVRATDTAGTPSGYIVVSYSQVNHWYARTTHNMFLSDANGAHILEFIITPSSVLCGRPQDRVATLDFDPQYFDLVTAGLFSIKGATWERC